MGFALLADSRRRRKLEEAFDEVLRSDLQDRVQPFDVAAATAAAGIAASQRRSGTPVEIRDVQIAGIAAARRANLATGNTRRFEGIGLALDDPWS